MTNFNTTDGEKHLFANDGSDWRSTAGPVSTKEAREIDSALDEAGRNGGGPAAANEVRLASSIVEGSEESNNAQYPSEESEE
jgi:hypothetical protein